MNITRLAKILIGAAVALTLSSCAPLPEARPSGVAAGGTGSREDRLKATYAEAAAAGGRVYALDPALSTVKIYAFRGGRAAARGHNHVLSAPKFTGFAYLPANGLSAARFDIELRLDELAIDDPRYRAGLGSAFASTPSAEDIEGTRKHMLGERNLQADQFPYAWIRAVTIAGEPPKLAARVEVELHGQTRDLWVPLDVQGLPEKLHVTGALVLRQSDFGIAPYSVFGGLLAVQDEIVVEFSLVGS